MTLPAYIRVAKAAKRLDMTPDAFSEWVRRWNRDNPDMLIRRMPARVRLEDLNRAVELVEAESRNQDLGL